MRSGIGLAAALMLAGCYSSTPPLGQGGPMVVEQATELPPPTGADTVQTGAPYLIGPSDQLTVTVFGAEELSGDVTADGNGRVAVPLAGTFDAAGRTPAELADMIAAGLRGRYVRNPSVTVNVREAVGQTFTVDGEVRDPGMFPVRGNVSLMRAIATAKGLGEFAKASDVVVFRTVGGRQMAAVYNLEAIRRGTYADPRIYPNDVVVVGDSPRRRFIRDAIQAAPVLATPLILLLQ